MKRIPSYKQIRDYILDQLKKQTWKGNDQLPSENELAAQFGVSRITIKNALSSLVHEGVIYRVQGKGTFISENAQGEKPLYKPPIGENARVEQASRPKLIGYLTPNISNHFTMSLLNEIEGALNKEGYHMVFARTHQSQEVEEKKIRELVAMGVQGIIVYPVEEESFNEEILRLSLSNYPLVVIDRYLRGVDTNCVCSDNIQGGYEATKHLLDLGHTDIGFISTIPSGTTSIEDRLSGYEMALSEKRIPIDSRLKLTHLKVFDQDNAKNIRHFLHTMTSMTAVVTVNATIGQQVLAMAAELNMRVPDQLSVVIFDDLDRLRIQPTYMKQEAGMIAHEAVRLLLQHINSPAEKKRLIEFPTTLIVRDTTAPLASKITT